MNTVGPVTPEQTGAPASVETIQNAPITPERSIPSPEQARTAEQLAVDHSGGKPLPITPLPTINQPQTNSQPAVDTNVSSTAGNPVSASDGDSIEKEWIDKVKQVISSTADNPHAQQKEISKLMADYVLKRTGRKIGKDGSQ